MRRVVLAVFVLVAAGALVFPSLASSFVDGDQVHEDVVIEPHAGPNGDYAVMEDGRLQLVFGPSNPELDGDGVAPNSVTPFDRVFNVTYTGEKAAAVWLTSDVSGLTFYRAADVNESLEGRENRIQLSADQTLVVGVKIDTRERTEFGTDQFTIHAEVADGSTPPTEEADDGADGTGVEEYEFDFDGNDNLGVPTTTAESTETATGTTTTAGRGADEPSFVVTTTELSPTTVTPGESVRVNATVGNDGERDRTIPLALSVDGRQADTKDVFVPAGETRTVTYTRSFETAGKYGIRVADVDVGTVVVERAAGTVAVTPARSAADVAQTPTAEQRPTDTSSGGGLDGILGGLVALAVVGGGVLTLGIKEYLQ